MMPRNLFRRLPAAGLLSLTLSLSVLLTACGLDKTAPVPTFGGAELYPLEVGAYRIFAVADTTWQARRFTVSTFQFRETVAEAFPDASSAPGRASLSYRLVRSRRASAAAAWVEDSVFVLTPLPSALLLSKNNRRTVELLFPVRAGRVWNRLVFDGRDSLSREYRRLGEALTLAQPGGAAPKTYSQVVRTYDPDEDNVYYLSTYEQAYAPGVGPVLRRRRRFFFTDGNGGSLPEPNGAIYSGFLRRETLVEQGKL